MKPTKQNLERLYLKYSRHEFLNSDPVEFPHRYKNRYDIEAVSFIASMFAYGNVKAMKKFLESVFNSLGPSPMNSICSGNMLTPGLYYRFQSEKDVETFLYALKEIYSRYNCPQTGDGKFNGIFSRITDGAGSDIKQRIDILRNLLTEAVPKDRRTRGYKHLIGAGGDSSARKRYCMFFRWMTRETFPDFSLYTNISPADLVIPLDTHIMKISIKTGLCSRKTQDWKTAVEITENLRKICPEDPLKYDFCLTRPGILKDIFPY